ncbi:MAG TPA: collagen binding domain-containing protein, partial [Feifaniaceae bacterium]|nr:collagen binding domain-containing protein [Feifaniaceae bacterium]
MQKKKLISMVLSICILIGAMTPGVAAAAMPEDLTGQTAYLAVHETGGSYAGLGGPSSLTVTAPGGAVISPVGNVYSNVPAGSALRLDLVFHLNDGDGEGVLYEYSGSSYFTVTLPEGITFASPSGEEANIYAVDESGGDPWLLGTWSFTGPNVIRVDFGPDVAAHTGMWGSIGIDGTFDAVGTGGDTETELVLGSQHITFTREVPPPAAIGIAKEGAYNPDDNTITWTVTITPPGSPSSLAGYTLVDTYSGNQSYQAGSFRHGAAVIADGGLDLTVADQISYTFPAGTEGEQTVTYKTSPDTFAAETGIDNVEASVFSNAASLKLGTEPAAGPATAEVTVDWISKSGTAVTADDPIVIRWQVDIAVPSGGSITGASIVDTLPAGLKLIENSGTYPIQISVNGGGAAAVPEGAGAGTYTYGYTGSGDPSTLSYRFPEADGVDGKLAGTARFTYYTEVTDREAYLNNNGAISSQNSAGLLWTLMPGATPPTDTASAGVVGEGGLLSKTAGSTQDYAHPGVIHWTITVNRNKISVPDAAIADTVPAGQELLIDAEHPFTVRKARAVQAQAATASGIPGLASGDGFVREFSYTFQDDPVTDTYTVDYYTRITDIGTLYANSPSGAPVGFGNAVALTRTGETVTADGTQYYNSQMLAKAVAEAYDYTNHVTKWRLTVNRNRLPLTNAVVTDTLPAGMALLIDAQHPFAVVENGPDGSDTPIAAAPTTGVNGGNSFTYAFGSTATTSQYTITFYTLLTDEALLSQWGGNKAFTNHAELDADEIAAPIGASATVNVRNPVISKSRAYAEGSDHIDWSVVINPGKMTLRSASVTDVLAEGLQLDPGSVKLYSVAVAADGTAAPASEGTLMTGGYTLDLPAAANGNTLTLTLPDNSSATYRLEFTTFVLSDDLDFTNTVSLTGSAGSPEGGASAQNIVINNLWSSGGSGSNTLTVHKEDGAGNPVAGAAYQLLNFNMQPVLKSGNPIKAVTDANGDAVFTNLPAWIFYAKEISAPDGYLLNPEPFGGGRLS